MCFRSRPPSPPKLPKEQPADSAIEPTATKVRISDDRSSGDMGSSKKKKKTSDKVTGGKLARAIAPKRLGTASLQIPLLTNSSSSKDLNYS